MNILILNAFSRNALAVINSLDSDYHLIGGVNRKQSWRNQLQKKLFHSRKLRGFAEYADPATDKEQFCQDIIDICNQQNIDVIFPTGTTTTNFLSYFKNQLQQSIKANILVEEYEKFSCLTDKWLTYQLCVREGVPVPKTILWTNQENSFNEIKALTFPIIAKPRISYASYGVHFFEDYASFCKGLDQLNGFSDPAASIDYPYIIQEAITGNLHDVALCAKEGRPLMMMSQKRVMSLRDFGGGGIINMTTDEPEMISYAERIIDALQWNGPALFDFIKTPDGQYYILEINPKIWGTTRLIVEAGMNLPQAMIDAFVFEKETQRTYDYEKNLLYKWMFPECMAAWFMPPFTVGTFAKRVRKSFSNHQASRVCHNLNIKDVPHLMGIILEKS